MRNVAEVAAEFLARKRIAVTGVSRTGTGHGANVVYQRLRERGYEVFAVNPNADAINDVPCFHDLKSIPGGVDAVVIGTRPAHADGTMRECAELGVDLVWMHRSMAGSSVSPTATEYGRAHDITVIDGGCPLMFPPVSDGGHRVMKWVCGVTGALPKRV